MTKRYDVIIIGAGSVGVPAAYAMSREGLKVAVIESLPSAGQGQNKKAIGGIRATHTNPSKILLCQDSIDILSNWEARHGHDIEWFQGGYTFVAYNEAHEQLMKENLVIQKESGLNINWVDREKIIELVPGISKEGLLGGTYSPEDGNSSPLKTLYAIQKQSLTAGAEYFFKESVTNVELKNGTVKKVITNKSAYEADFVINAAGASAKQIGEMVGLNLPISPDSHESGISEPVQKFIDPLVVDLRPGEGTKNFYFYQNIEGKFILCLTPEPIIPGINENETSVFLPQVAQRLICLIPRTKHLKMRRTWRGLYPMTPDGSPIVGKVTDLEGYINAVGMCGQGFMLGPGLGELLARIVMEKTSPSDDRILEELSLERDFGKVEKLK
ncbi:MAG: FAD-binding oxidoreductase [Candidatus Heimdallarchaeota archaeon]|nr:FAD-binding oxidoreductase [Candidatus Heimdallarchaeota archaeon]MCK4613030.1 FAD-binding oxidoreductase [Candidatus Heimdallarchaeota archaeon]